MTRLSTLSRSVEGKAGVTRALELIRNELDVSMALTGVSRLGDVDHNVLW